MGDGLLREAWLHRGLRSPLPGFSTNPEETGLTGSQVPTQAEIDVCDAAQTVEPGRGVGGIGQSSAGRHDTSAGVWVSRLSQSSSNRYDDTLEKHGLEKVHTVNQKCDATRRGWRRVNNCVLWWGASHQD